MNFSDPYAISPYEIQDKLIFHIKEEAIQFFYSNEFDEFINYNERTLTKRIRR